MPKPTLIRSSINRQEDGAWMQQALEIARQSVGLAHPNPVVGALVVKHGKIVGRGRHAYDRRDHADPGDGDPAMRFHTASVHALAGAR